MVFLGGAGHGGGYDLHASRLFVDQLSQAFDALGA